MIETMSATTTAKTHKDWRKEVKKLRRKRIRCKLAKEKDRKEEEIQAKLLSDPNYLSWLQDQEKLDEFQKEMEQRQYDEQEEKWLRRELLAQKKFQEEKKRQEAVDEAKEKERQKIQKEFEEQQKIILERLAEKKQLAEEKQRNHELLLKKIDDFVKNGGKLPEELHEMAETNPGKDPCPFFIKMASCRFGDKCSRNHSRPAISRTLLLHHFFTNIRLDQPQKSEYGTDLSLEYSERELYLAYEEFFEDVTNEMCKFGEIINFRTCKNTQPQLRGNVYVEYRDERSAMRAFQKLHCRYYASRRINVEFCKIISWRAAICGLSFSRKCPKGDHCNYLHIFKNPKNKYNTRDPPTEGSMHQNTENVNDPKQTPSWDDIREPTLRNWRWSESPENDVSSNKTRQPRSSPERSTSRSDHSREERRNSERSSRRSRTRSKSPYKRSAHRWRSRSRSAGSRSKRSARKFRSISITPKRKRRDESRSLDSRRTTRRNSQLASNNNSPKSIEHNGLRSDQIYEEKLKSRSKSRDRDEKTRRKRRKSKSRKKENKEKNN